MINALEHARVQPVGQPKSAQQIDRTDPDPGAAASVVFENAELLLQYAADNGLTVDAKVRSVIFTTKAEYVAKTLKPERLAELYTAYTTLAAASHPVTVETIRACRDRSDGTFKRYQRNVLLLTAFVILLGIISFVSSSITQKIGDDIASANAVAVKLGAQLGVLPSPQSPFDNSAGPARTPASSSLASVAASESKAIKDQGLPAGLAASDALSELQQFTALLRDIYRRAVSLNAVLPFERDPYSEEKRNPANFWPIFQLPTKIDDFRQTSANEIFLYQQVRAFGNDVQFDQTILYGVIGTYFLPVLYALLGAFAYRLREFGAEIRNTTYHPSRANSVRLVTAAICGAIVGLFNNFWQGVSLPPLAIAFLVLFGVDVFVMFLDKLLQTFGTAGPTTAQAGSPNSGNLPDVKTPPGSPAPVVATTVS